MPTRQTGKSFGFGVTYDRWRARVKHDGREIYLGSFPTRQEAQEAEEAKRRELTYPSYYEPTEDAWFAWVGNRYIRSAS